MNLRYKGQALLLQGTGKNLHCLRREYFERYKTLSVGKTQKFLMLQQAIYNKTHRF